MEKQAENPWELKDFLQHPAKMSLEEISEAIFLRMSAKAKALDRRVGCLRGGASAGRSGQGRVSAERNELRLCRVPV